MIPVADPRRSYLAHRGAINDAIQDVLHRGTYVLGDEIEKFESEFASYLGAKYAIGVGSGTDALTISLLALGIGRGDEVITVSHTAIATVAAILATGATPVLVDIDETYTMGPIEHAITPKTKAIIPVHLYGYPANLDALLPYGIPIIEDCAQACGASFHKQKVGTIGDLGAFSFYPTKNLGAIGEAGCIVTSDSNLADKCRQLRQYGWDNNRVTHRTGRNSRLDPIQAAVLRVKLPHLDNENERRRAIADKYGFALEGVVGQLPYPGVYHLYVIQCDNRDRLAIHLAHRGIQTGIHYPQGAHTQNGYITECVVPKALTVTNRILPRILSLPMYPELTSNEVATIIHGVRSFYGAD